MSLDYRVCIDGRHNPKGTDGRGWNRMAIHGLEPTTRCSMRPVSRQAALDTLRGMAKLGVATEYKCCVSDKACNDCHLITKAKDPWVDSWSLRESANGNVWLLGDPELGFTGSGYCFKDWADLLVSVEVPELKRMQNAHGFFWVAKIACTPLCLS